MVTIKECCAICENLYDADKCPLFKTYNCAAEYCVDDFDKVAKYHVCCEKFETIGEYKAAIEIAEKHPDLTSTEIKVNFDRNES